MPVLVNLAGFESLELSSLNSFFMWVLKWPNSENFPSTFAGRSPKCNIRWNIRTCEGREDWGKRAGSTAVSFIESSHSFW